MSSSDRRVHSKDWDIPQETLVIDGGTIPMLNPDVAKALYVNFPKWKRNTDQLTSTCNGIMIDYNTMLDLYSTSQGTTNNKIQKGG